MVRVTPPNQWLGYNTDDPEGASEDITEADLRNTAGDHEEPGEARRTTEWNAGLAFLKEGEKAGR